MGGGVGEPYRPIPLLSHATKAVIMTSLGIVGRYRRRAVGIASLEAGIDLQKWTGYTPIIKISLVVHWLSW